MSSSLSAPATLAASNADPAVSVVAPQKKRSCAIRCTSTDSHSSSSDEDSITKRVSANEGTKPIQPLQYNEKSDDEYLLFYMLSSSFLRSRWRRIEQNHNVKTIVLKLNQQHQFKHWWKSHQPVVAARKFVEEDFLMTFSIRDSWSKSLVDIKSSWIASYPVPGTDHEHMYNNPGWIKWKAMIGLCGFFWMLFYVWKWSQSLFQKDWSTSFRLLSVFGDVTASSGFSFCQAWQEEQG